MPSATSEIEISANAISLEEKGAPGHFFVDAGHKINLSATGAGNASSLRWDFGTNISGPDTRYAYTANVSRIVHAAGAYNVTFTAFYGDESVEKKLTLIVTFEEQYQGDIVHNEALFFAVAGSEIIMSSVLGYWTHRIRQDKVYL